MKLIKLLILCVWALACGSYDDLDIVTTDQDFVSQGNGSAGAGNNPVTGYSEPSLGRATQATTGRIVVPGVDVVRYAIAATLSAGSVTSAAAAMNSPLGGARFVNDQSNFRLAINNGTVAGASDSVIEHYASFVCQTEGTALTESLPGIYVRWTSCTATIDLAKINAKGATGVEDTNLLRHALLHVMNLAVGNGTQLLDGTVGTARNITPLNAAKKAYTPGEECRTNLYQATVNPGQFVVSTSGEPGVGFCPIS